MKKIHFIGIGGVGMAGLAVLLKAEGHEVTGCDLHASPRTRWLEEQGIPVAIGHHPSHVAAVDEVIVTPAVHRDNPEFLAAPHIRMRGEVLAEVVSARESIAVCGSHGKTTTATFIARLLLALGEDVAWAIGGETGAFPVAGTGGAIGLTPPNSNTQTLKHSNTSPNSNTQTLKHSNTSSNPNTQTPKHPNNSSPLVVEADESDGTLALYHASTLVVTNCEYDHPDHFKTPEDYFACYDTARRNARDVIESEALAPLDLPSLEGLAPHNRKNARAAIEVALRRGHSLAAIEAALPAIVQELPDRRFQKIWPRPCTNPSDLAGTPRPIGNASVPQLHSQLSTLNSQLSLYTDYAHHPTEMACAVSMARAICRGTLRVLFQPHRYSRTKALLRSFPSAFEQADEVILCPTYAAFEDPVEGGDVADLYAACRAADLPRPVRFFLARTCEEAWEHARNTMAEGDLTLLLGAGDIIALVPRVQADLASGVPAPRRKILIGAGSNTWKSDLSLSVDYVTTEGPAGKPGAALVAAHPTLLPWMAGIPGTVGGWIKMNAGAFGHSISEVLAAVKVDGRWIPAAACGFGYRTSAITGEIQDYKLIDDPTDGPAPTEFLARRKRFPAGTKGSVFKNPPNDFAGRLLEAVGAKDLSVGGAFVWKEHANVIVSGPNATPSDFLALAHLMRERVRLRLGVTLDPEVRGLGVEC